MRAQSIVLLVGASEVPWLKSHPILKTLFLQDLRVTGSHIQSLGRKTGNAQLYP